MGKKEATIIGGIDVRLAYQLPQGNQDWGTTLKALRLLTITKADDSSNKLADGAILPKGFKQSPAGAEGKHVHVRRYR